MPTYTNGYAVDANRIAWDSKALPNAGSADGDAAVEMAPHEELVVIAATDITVATGGAANLEIEVYSDDTLASAAPPFANSSGWLDDAHEYLIHKTSADDALAFAAGDVIAIWAMPHDFPKSGSTRRRFVNLKAYASGDLRSMKLDAFVRAA